MVVEIPLQIEREVERITVAEAPERIARLSALGPAFGFLSDVPEDRIEAISATIARTKAEGFGHR